MSRVAVAAFAAGLAFAAGCSPASLDSVCADGACPPACAELGAGCAAPADCCSGACDASGHCTPRAALVVAAAPSVARADGVSFANVWVLEGIPPVTLTATAGAFAGGGQSIVLSTIPGVARLETCDASSSPACAGTALVTVSSTANDPTSVAVVLLPVERCDNGLDDDGDALTDCADPDCGEVACDTGLLGLCGLGVSACGGTQPCQQVAYPASESCNGADDDCDGAADEGACIACYDGPAGTEGVGQCHGGTLVYGLPPFETPESAPCVGQVLPATETCNGLDDDCDGVIDDHPPRTCFDGPDTAVDAITGLPKGACTVGVQACADGQWGACTGQILPAAEDCGVGGTGNGADDDCDGLVDETCSCPAEGMVRTCYSGPAGSAGVAECRAGLQSCQSGAWSDCVGEVTPAAEVCGNGRDEDCNGVMDDLALCPTCPTPPASCYDAPISTLGVGSCKAGERECREGVLGACVGQVLPMMELCNGLDDDCDGVVDEGSPSCGANACVNGNCVPSACDPDRPCGDGYVCQGGLCAAAPCGAGPVCPAGTRCVDGACVDPCLGVACGAGAVCASGLCTGGSCYMTGCGVGLICRQGYCTADPCTGVSCAAGTFCREGQCVTSCVYVACPSGQRCGLDGACEADPCAEATCTPGTACREGNCVADPCASLGCGSGMVCNAGSCVDDPCAAVRCPIGSCDRGQCY